MDDLDFDTLFTENSKDYAIGMIERLFGSIVTTIRDGGGTGGNESWLADMFLLFNMAGLLAILVVSMYTVLTVVFDTAADGKTFGQNADTRYTVMRAVLGGIAFIPVKGGFSVAQVILIWLMIQGSYLGDTAWTRTAEVSLSGRSLLAPPAVTTMDDYVVQQQFANAFDALVLGHLCAYNANQISNFFSNPNSGASAALAGPMKIQTIDQGPKIRQPGLFDYSLLEYRRKDLRHTIYFGEDSDDNNAYSGRKNTCGGVEKVETLVVGGTKYSGFRDNVINTQKISRFDSYVTAINAMAVDAANVAKKIFNGERNTQVLERDTRVAVKKATDNYLAGVKSTNSISEGQLKDVQDKLLDQATEYGWAFAPSWQRGIAMAGAAQGKATEGFTIDSDRRMVVDDVLSFGQGYNPDVRAFLASARDDEQTWDLLAPTVHDLGEPGDESEYSPLAAANSGDSSTWVNRLYQSILSWFALSGGAQQNSSFYTDPMIDVTAYGNGLMTTGALLAGGGYIIDGAVLYATSGVAGGGEFTGFIKTIGWGFLTAGFVTATIIPMIPFVYFYSAVLSWILLIVEAMFAIPLAILTLFTPAREGTLIGSWNKILLSIFGIFLRPIFTIIGLIVGMLLISLALAFLYDLFYGMMGMMAPGATWSGIIMMLGFVLVFMFMTLYTVLIGSSLITELGDGAMNWLGIGLSSLGQRMNMGDKIVGETNVSGRSVGSLQNMGIASKGAKLGSSGTGKESDQRNARNALMQKGVSKLLPRK